MLVRRVEQILDSAKIPLLAGGDFSGRIGALNALPDECVEETNLLATRDSLDVIVDKNGHSILDHIESLRLTVLKSRSPSDTRGDFTYVGSKSTNVIDYAWVKHEAMKLVTDFSVLSLDTLDHLPIAIYLKHTTADGGQEILIILTAEHSVKIKWVSDLARIPTAEANAPFVTK